MAKLEKVIEIFDQIKNTNSLNEKQEIIRQNQGNEYFLKFLRFLLDDQIVTGISSKKYKKINVKTSDWHHEDSCEEFEKVLNYIQEHNTGRDEDIIKVKSWCCNFSDKIKEFTEQMITKSYKLGADKKLINKVIPNLIPTFDVMLGTPIDKTKLKGDEWISLSQKLNGTRCSWIGNKLMTRQGKEYIGLQHIIDDLNRLGLQNMFVDGELRYKNKEGLSDSESFQIGTGIAMSKDKDKSDLMLIVFDIFPLNEFWSGKSKKTYSKRYEELQMLKHKILHNNIQNVDVVQTFYQGTDHTEIWKWLDYAEEHDMEGIMINLDTPYECKRTKTLIKVKRFYSCDIYCLDIEEGSGRNKGTLGALICDYKGNRVNVGSGFTDEDRKRYWSNPNDIIGKIVSVKYKEETKNKDGGISIQFPVFECIRRDKNEPSYN